MGGSGNSSKREGKRRLDEGDHDDYGRGSAPKQQKTPAFDKVMFEALKRDGLEKLFSYCEPHLRKIIREENKQLELNVLGKLERLIRLREEQLNALKIDILSHLAGGSVVKPHLSLTSSPLKIQESGGRKLQLRIETKMPGRLFAGKKVKGVGGSAIHVSLIDLSDGSVAKTGPESIAKLNVLVLRGDFNEDFNDGWTHEDFKKHQEKERDGKAPLLIGDTQLNLNDGVGVLGDFSFTDNSAWTRSKKFRLGVELAPGFCEGSYVMEAKTEAIRVLDPRGESYRKHDQPALQDKVFRLKGIAKGNPLHKNLLKAGIITVADFLRLNAKDPQKLRTVLGSGMTDTMWKRTIEHAKTCDLSSGKCYVFYSDESQRFGVIFNHIHEFKGCITNGQVLLLKSLAQTKEVSYHVKKAYENWDKVIEYDDDVLQSSTTTKEIETRQEELVYSINHNTPYAPINYPYPTHEPILQIQPGNMSERSQFEFPLLNADQTCMGLPLTNPEIGIVGSSMYTNGETSGAGCSNSLKDCAQTINGPELEKLLRGLAQVMNDEETVKLSFTNQEVGETSGAGCSYSSKECFAPNNRPMTESIVDEETMENTGFNLGQMGLAAIFRHSNVAHYFYGKEPEPKYDEPYEVVQLEVEHGMNRGKAAVGWLKIKVALRWGIMAKRKAAERRAQLTELV